jgi:hypothetical protein
MSTNERVLQLTRLAKDLFDCAVAQVGADQAQKIWKNVLNLNP